ncbi:thiolase family protein [Phytohabitans suffuscus]|uniref:Acetyl-CoA acetyltransferase n=2 Tax=Phytohabitans suffuscus TaxID=624315 RepID=A0A6F8YR89_9ACTN|nr:acetyl-CoA C-acyltransferase [Phytohabitans suffuscus]BCB88612.1 acetyl-CoA acetyltransferase [Phytohabitans suffuscus]
MSYVMIIDAVRSPVAKRRGSLAGAFAPDLFGTVLAGVVERSGVDAASVGQVIGGCVNQAGQQSANITRNAWLGAGLPLDVAGSTVNAQCGSGQQAVTLAYGLIAGGITEVAIGGGVESMDQVPMGSSLGSGLGDPRAGGFAEHYEVTSQFEGADRIAEGWGLSRNEIDEFAVRSQQRAAAALAEDRFRGHIIPVLAPGEDGRARVVTQDEGPRPTTAEGLAGLKLNQPDRPGAVHTAGSSSQIADGASAVLLASEARVGALGLEPRARIVDSILVGSDPVLMLTGPIPATRAILERNNLTIDDIDAIEINEAFAAVVLAWQRELKAPWAKVNVNGGAIALGHPLGATGGVLIAKVLTELERSGGRRGLVTMCCGGGLGTATLVERL